MKTNILHALVMLSGQVLHTDMFAGNARDMESVYRELRRDFPHAEVEVELLNTRGEMIYAVSNFMHR